MQRNTNLVDLKNEPLVAIVLVATIQNEPLVAIVGVHTAENEPLKV